MNEYILKSQVYINDFSIPFGKDSKKITTTKANTKQYKFSIQSYNFRLNYKKRPS